MAVCGKHQKLMSLIFLLNTRKNDAELKEEAENYEKKNDGFTKFENYCRKYAKRKFYIHEEVNATRPKLVTKVKKVL